MLLRKHLDAREIPFAFVYSVLLPERFSGNPPCTFGTHKNEILQSRINF